MGATYFFCDRIAEATKMVTLDSAESQHAVRVMRLGTGDTIRLLDGRGAVGDAVITSRSGSERRPELVCRVQTRWQAPECRPRLHLYVAPPRPKQMVQIVRQATELGVWRIVPVICEYSVARPDDDVRDGHWRREAVAALKQSGNPFLPIFEAPVTFGEATARESFPGVYGAVPRAGEGTGPSAFLASQAEPGADVGIWIGPEGGFADAEIDLLSERGLAPLTVGHYTLRVETAVPALVGAVLALLTGQELVGP